MDDHLRIYIYIYIHILLISNKTTLLTVYLILHIAGIFSDALSFIPLFSIYPHTGKTMDVERVKNIKSNIVQHTMLSH